MEQSIYCTVASCYYYKQGDQCAASKIMVKNNPATLSNSKMEVGTLGSQADHSHQTFCETFVPQSHGPKTGISRVE